MRKIFAVHDLPCQIVSDKGSQFSAYHSKTKRNQTYSLSTPNHPAMNGEAERFTQTFKNAMKSAKYDSGTLEIKLACFLLMYWNTPNFTTGQSPAQLLTNLVETN